MLSATLTVDVVVGRRGPVQRRHGMLIKSGAKAGGGIHTEEEGERRRRGQCQGLIKIAEN